MMKKRNKLIILSVIVFLAMGNINAKKTERIHKEFKGKRSVRINTVSGDCVIKQGSPDKILVDLVYSVWPPNTFEPEFKERKEVLTLKERWFGSSSFGDVTWTLTVPQKTEIEFSTASGDLSLEGMNNSIEANTASGDITIENSEGRLNFNTASGDIEAHNIKGEFEMSTASGEIEIKNSIGIFELSSASGEIDASNTLIEEESSFSTASGDVDVELSRSSEYDIELRSASGNVTLNYNGNPINGYFEFIAKKHKGKIRSPIKFDNEEEFERDNQIYVRKSFTSGGQKPKILIKTASGRATLKK